MIEGIRFEVPSDELANIFRERARYHKERGAQQAEELPRLKKIIDGLKLPAHMNEGGMPGITYGNSQYAGRDPVADLESRIASHKTAAMKAEFYAAHVVRGEVYRLQSQDLAIIGLSVEHHEMALIAMAFGR